MRYLARQVCLPALARECLYLPGLLVGARNNINIKRILRCLRTRLNTSAIVNYSSEVPRGSHGSPKTYTSLPIVYSVKDDIHREQSFQERTFDAIVRV